MTSILCSLSKDLIRHFVFRILLTSTLVSAASIEVEAQAISFETIALSGDPAPGAGNGVKFGGFFAPVLNDLGKAAFKARLTGAGVTHANDVGVFSEPNGTLGLVAREGDPATGTSLGVNFSDVSSGIVNGQFSPLLNNAGQTAFLSLLSGTGVDSTNNTGLFSEVDGTLGVVVREGDEAPGTGSGVRFGNLTIFENFSLNNSGETVFHTNLTGTGVDSTNDRGIFSNSGGTLHLIAREGDAVPGTASGVNFSSFDSPPTINDAGQILFPARLSGASVNNTNERGIFLKSGNSMELLVRQGDAAPGAGPGVELFSFHNTTLNNSGQAAFSASLTGPNVNDTNNVAIYSGFGGMPRLVVREGDPAPGAGPGVSIDFSFTFDLKVNNAGWTAFGAALTGNGVDGSNFIGLFSEFGGTLGLVARSGDAAPGTNPGTYFRGFEAPLLSDSGQTAFLASFFGPSVNLTNLKGLFATDEYNILQLVVREGDLFDVNPDPAITDNRIIGGIHFEDGFGDPNGRPNSFTKSGQIAFTLGFTDGTSGIFIATIGVAEPVSIGLIAAGFLSLLCRRS